MPEGGTTVSSATGAAFTGRAAATVRRLVTVVVFVIASLAFAFGFGNGWALGLRLGVPAWIAPLVAPAVDLSVVALLVAVQYLSAHGVPGRQLLAARLLLVVCGLATLALNTTQPVLTGSWGRACFDSIPPALLIGWSEVAPRLLGLLHADGQDGTVPVPDGPETVPAQVNGHKPRTIPAAADKPEDGGQDRPVLAPALVEAARRADAEHRASTGRRIPRDILRARLRISNALAGELLRHIEPVPAGPLNP
jgi:hypothetical protein